MLFITKDNMKKVFVVRLASSLIMRRVVLVACSSPGYIEVDIPLR
jgi:hypothetical protein